MSARQIMSKKLTKDTRSLKWTEFHRTTVLAQHRGLTCSVRMSRAMTPSASFSLVIYLPLSEASFPKINDYFCGINHGQPARATRIRV